MKLHPGQKKTRSLVGKIRGRFILLLLGVVFWVAVIVCRLINVQILHSADMKQLAQRQQNNIIRIAPSRGRILDARMNELALSCKTPSFYACPPEIEDAGQAAAALSRALGVNRQELLSRLRAKGRSFVWIKRKANQAELEVVDSLGIKGIYSLEENGRKYPKNALAANLLGYVGIDNNGLSGLEHGYEDRIGGKPGFRIRIRDAKGQKLLIPRVTQGQPMPGNDLVLTIDEVVQFYAERELANGVQQSKAKAGVAVVMEPGTGAVLAMAVHPGFDPNNYTDYPQTSWRNRAVTDCFEPGSVMKVFVMAGCLEHRLVRLNEIIDCGRGGINVGGVRINDHRPFDKLDPASIIVHSSNVGAIRLGMRLGPSRLHGILTRFGFGAQTGIELPGESKGILRDPANWSSMSVGSISIGQEMSASALQLAAAFSSVANRGVRMRPRIVARELSTEGEILTETKPEPVKDVISPETAETLISMMEGVVEKGTGTKAAIAGYGVAGKTGTAQKIGSTGGYEPGKYFGVFAGVAPSRNPKVTIVVALDEPAPPGHHGGECAAPVFAGIAAATLRYLRVPQEGAEVTLASRASAESEPGQDGAAARLMSGETDTKERAQ